MASSSLQIYLGPVTLPRSITAERATIRLFMAYITRTATKDALRRRVREVTKFRLSELEDALAVASGHSQIRTHEDLRRLVANAPEFVALSGMARTLLGTRLLPEDARPSEELEKVFMETYHKWVRALARQR